MRRHIHFILTRIKLILVPLLIVLGVGWAAIVGHAAPEDLAGPHQGAGTAFPLLCAGNVAKKYCDLQVVLLIDDTGSMRSNDPTLMRDQGAKNLVDILDQEYYQAAVDAKAKDPGVVLPDVRVAVIHFSHCSSSDPADHCSSDVKFNSGWLSITQKDQLYSSIDWLKSRPNFYHIKQFTHFIEPFQSAVDLFNQPDAQTKSDCVHRLTLLLTDGTPEDVHGPLNEPDLGNEMLRVGSILKGFTAQADHHVYVTAFKILPRYWGPAEPYWQDIAGSSNVSLETSLDGVASRMEKIAAANIGAQSSTLSSTPDNPRLYSLELPHHVQSLRITYYKLDPNATFTLSDPNGATVIPDGKAVVESGQGTSIEVWSLARPAAGSYQIKTSVRGGILTAIPLFAASLELDEPSAANPLLQFTKGQIQFKLVDGANQPILPTDDPAFQLNLQASLAGPSGQSMPLALTPQAEGYQAAWMPFDTDPEVLHVNVELIGPDGNSVWKCGGDGGQLPVDAVGVAVDVPPVCAAVNKPVHLPLHLANARTGQDTGIDLPVQWTVSSSTVPGAGSVDSSIETIDAKTGSYQLTIRPVVAENVQSHIEASVVVNGSNAHFYSGDVITTICPLPPAPSCSKCGGYWNYVLWALLLVLLILPVTRRLFHRRKRERKYRVPSLVLLIALILLVLFWTLLCCSTPLWALLFLLLILLLILVSIRVIRRRDHTEPSPMRWPLILLLLLLILIWIFLFSALWIYAFLMFLILLVILSLIWFNPDDRDEAEPFPLWLLLILPFIIVLLGLTFLGNFAFSVVLLLAGIWLILMLMIGLISHEADWRSSYRFWLMVVGLFILILVSVMGFKESLIYVLWLFMSVLILWLVGWLIFRHRNPPGGVIRIVDKRSRTLWSQSLEGRSSYHWRFEDPICTVTWLQIRSWDQRDRRLALVVHTPKGTQDFRRNLNEWEDCKLDGGCRIVWGEGEKESKPRKIRRKQKPGSSRGKVRRRAV